jgi:ATPase family associated with various cellular activities (AAA)
MMPEFRLCATWLPPDDPGLRKLLIFASGSSTFPGYPTQLFRVDINTLWPSGGKLFWQSIDVKSLNRPAYRKMCECLLLELGCPPMSADLTTPGSAEHVLLRLLSEEIGIGQFPNEHLNPVDVAGRLIYEAQAARAKGVGLARTNVISLLRLRTDYGRVSQMFPVRWKEAIDFADVRKTILGLVKENQRTLVTGPPGSGKSWALTRLARDLKQDGFAVGRHYCYVSVNDADAPKRVLIDTLYGNLTDSLIQAVPDFAALNRPFFAAGPAEFQGLLARACDEYPEKKIVLIIDGLDHIARIRALHGEISSAGSDIVGELASLCLPKNASLVLGSQPGDHLKALHSKCKIVPFPAWTSLETQNFLSRVGIRKHLAEHTIKVTAAVLSTALYGRSKGNPLYTWYLVQEIRKSLLRQDARTPVEIISAAPAYDEHLNTYYTFLLESGQRASENVASILACIDFGLTRQQLHDIGGTWAAKLLDATLDDLRPVLDETSSQGGIRIYHDSFRRFVLNRIGNVAAIAQVLEPVIVWLQKRGFYDDSLAFRFLIPSLARAGRDAEILSLVTPTFVSEAVGGGHFQVAIMANLTQAAWASVRSLDLAQLAAIAELHKAAWTAFEDNLRFLTLEYGSAFAAVFGGTALAERLLFDGKPTLQREEGLLLCQVCDRNGSSAPWAEYGVLEKQKHEGGGWESAALAEFSGLLRIRGFKSLSGRIAKFLQSKDEQPPMYLEGILREIGRIEGPLGLSQLTKLKFKCNSTAAAVYFECARANLEHRQRESGKAFLSKSARRVATPICIAKCIDVGLSRSAAARLVKKNEHLRLCPPPSTEHSPSDDTQHAIWIGLSHIHGYIRNPQLQHRRAEITEKGWYPAWLRFVIDLSTATSVAPTDASKAIIDALRELATFKNPFEGSPRACDLYRLHGVIRETFRRALRMTASNDWSEALSLLEKISNETSIHISGERGFSGPLSSESLASILEEFVVRPDVSQSCQAQLAKLAAAVEEKGEYYSSVARHRFGLAEAQAKCGFRNASLKSWRFASRALCGYGWRKDRTVWELFEPIPILSKLDQTQAESALRDSQPFSDAVLLHTDGRETKHAPNGWFAALSGTNPAHAATVLARSITEDGGTWHWRWETAIEDLLEQVQHKSEPLLTLLLDLVRPWEPRGHWQKYDRMIVLKTLGTDSAMFQSTIGWVAAKFRDEPDPPDKGSLDLISEFAPHLHIVPVEASAKVDAESMLGDKEQNFDPVLRTPRFPHSATPLQILSALRRDPGEYGAQIRLVDWVNSLGYRLVELLDSGDSENVTRILTAFGAEWHYEGAGEALLNLADGFTRHGYSDAACEALVIAFRQLGESQALGTFTKAVVLNRTRAVQVIIESYARLLDQSWGVQGIPMRLIMVAVALRDAKLGFAIRRHAASVIEERLWGTEQSSLTFARYNPTELPTAKVEEAISYLIVARTSHPENWRRLSAMASIAILVQQNTAFIAWGIDQYLRNNALNTSTLSILELLWEFENSPYDVSQRLTEILGELAGADLFSMASLARKLLNRAGITTAARRQIYIPKIFGQISIRRVEAALSLDSGDRLERLESIWPGVSTLFAAELDHMMQSNELNRERMHRRWEAAKDKVYPERPLTQGNRWEGELFELVLQRILMRVPDILLGIGAWGADSERQLLQFASPGTALHVARFLSRIPRPHIALPSEMQGNQVDELERIDVAANEEWFLLGRYEEQILLAGLGTSEQSRQFTAYSGIISDSSPDSSLREIPLGHGNWQDMWSISSTSSLSGALRWSGALAGLGVSDSYLGRYPFLGLSSGLREMVHLVKGRVGALVLLDANGKAAVKMRSWWTLGANDHRERGDRELGGCELVARSDVTNLIRSIASHPLLFSTVVRERPLTRTDHD